MIKEMCSYVASFVKHINLYEKKINDLKDKILSIEMNLKDSNDRLGVMKQEIEQRDNSLASAKRLENILRVKLSEHLTQKKKI